ncbi:invasin domain 3-containing protein [Aeriscardovia aeriphila]|uniref:Surface anchored protein n=1 Tax=Aeriscardovia aeriphila TaxID=218139 RepID=A0A261F7N8_9BIFI|nr:invasin domain 3-containing protein [Aeriscardovia aeriphila]NYI25067.1 protocatechuate 3,4-dioxygenase beta subunit [Aeriscardovia aeriphila]OZG55142.1 surface anchored protein [Aeriscardovia aeriphila]
MYYFGQYRDADGNEAAANWQDLAKACLAGNDTASRVSSQSSSPCGDYVEWLNGSGKSFAAGQSDLSDSSTRYVDGKDHNRSLKQFNMFAQQIGGLQAFEWNTGSFDKSTENLGQIVTVEFTTQRTPWAGNGNEKVHRTFVAGHYKGNYRSYLYQGTQCKYVETPEKDSDGDGLTDRFELGIGSCPFPKDSAEYNETPNCKGVEDPTDTDGDGVPDSKEVKSQTPKLHDSGFKIEGTDPTVPPQKPSNPSDPTGHKGEKVTGKTRPYETVELYDLSTGAVIASTIADENGNYTLEPGRILSRTDGDDGRPKSFNKYGNNIQFASEEDEAARKPVMMDGGTPVPDGENHLVAVRVWSDGMDPLPGSEATRPQFDTPTGVLPSLKVDEKTPVQDPHHLTDDEKQKVKDDINKSVPGASDVVVNDDGSATVTIGGSQYTIPSQDLITTAPALPADPAHSSIGKPSKTTVPVSDGTSADGKASFTVTLKDENGKPVTDADNLTVTREDGKQVKPEIVNNGDGAYTVTVSSQEAATSPLKVSVGDTEIGSTTPITFEQPAPAQPNIQVSTSHCSAVVADGDSELNPGDKATVDGTIVDENGKPIAGRELTVVLPDGTTVPAVTDKDGKIVGKDGQPITFTVGDKDGEVKIFDGSDTVEPDKPVVTAPVHVVTPVEPVKKADPEHSSVTVSPANPNKGDTVVVSGVVKDSDGNPIAGQEVTIVLPDGSTVSGTTDKDGKLVGKDGRRSLSSLRIAAI